MELRNKNSSPVLITGAAGFIGSQLVDRFLSQGYSVIGVDNFSRGTEANLADAMKSSSFECHRINLAEEAQVMDELLPHLKDRGIEEVWHLAANSDIPAGVRDLRVDLRDTFLTTANTLLLAKELKVRCIAFASTSAVYGECDDLLHEDKGPLLPISNYGAMKLASEASISAAVEAYLEQAWIFRFPNVIGPRLTHGIIFDLLAKLERDSTRLEVLGDGTQRKPYLHSSDLIDAMLFIRQHAAKKVNLYNIGPEDEGALVSEIAAAVLRGVDSQAPIAYTGGDRGWVGDVPRFRYSVARLAQLGWRSPATSLDAVHRTIAEVVAARRAEGSRLCRQ